MALGHIDSGRLRPETCRLSRIQLLLAEELILAGLDAENHAKVMGWRIATVAGIQRITTTSAGKAEAEKFVQSKFDLFTSAADSAFPYLGLSTMLRGGDLERKRIMEASDKVRKLLDMNPDMTAEEFLASNF